MHIRFSNAYKFRASHEIPLFCGNRMLNAVVKIASHYNVPRASSIHPTPIYHIALKPILILSYCLNLGLSSGLLLSKFQTKILYVLLNSRVLHAHSIMQLSPSWEAATCAAPHELPSILWNTKVHYRVHKSPPLFPTLSQITQIHTIPFYLSKIRFNIVHPTMFWSSQWSPFLCLSHQYPICICCVLCLSIFSQFNHFNDMWRRV
jgi:hypothetical protein